MACYMPDTQTPDILSLTPTIKSNIISPVKPWGRLYSTYIHLEAVDLEGSSFKLGRSEDCDVIITDEKLDMRKVQVISKCHFVIYKEAGLVYIEDRSKNGTFLNGTRIGYGQKNILQNDDEISIGFRGLKVYVFKVLESDENKYLPVELRKKYQVSRTLGNGACGEVKLIFDKVTCLPYAVKKINKAKESKSAENKLNHPAKIKSEIDILNALKHPLIIEMKEIVETDECVFIILEYMQGGELTDLILSKTGMTEDEVKFIFSQIARAVQYLHGKGITHRDLKPENVLLKDKSCTSIAKVSDFGLSKLLEENYMMETICGTPNYVAPEVINRNISKYTQKVDIWSLGVLLYYMLSQELPFRSGNRTLLNRRILEGQYNFKANVWKNISEEAKDLVSRMLTVDPSKRITADEIMLHPWIEEDLAIRHRVEDLIYNEMETEIAATDSEDSPPAKRSRLSDSY